MTRHCPSQNAVYSGSYSYLLYTYMNLRHNKIFMSISIRNKIKAKGTIFSVITMTFDVCDIETLISYQQTTSPISMLRAWYSNPGRSYSERITSGTKPLWTEVTCYIGNKTIFYSASIDGQLKTWITARTNWEYRYRHAITNAAVSNSNTSNAATSARVGWRHYIYIDL